MEPPIEDSRRLLDELDHDELLDAAYGLFRRATLAECEVARLREALNIDKTGLGAGLNRVRSIANGYSWLAEDGVWGSYEYEERTVATLRREIGDALAAIHEAADQSLRQSGDLVQQTFRFNASDALAANGEDLDHRNMSDEEARAILAEEGIDPDAAYDRLMAKVREQEGGGDE